MAEQRLGHLLKAGADGLSPELLEQLPTPWRLRGSGAAGYDLTDEALIAAVQTAMLLGQPLILAGEPGVGKTSLAAALAHRLRLVFHDPVQVKSVTTGLDLFYAFDEVARFRDAGAGAAAAARIAEEAVEPKGLRDYVRFSSLGRAILWSAGPDARVATGSVAPSEILGKETGEKGLRLGDLFPLEFRRAVVGDDGSVDYEPITAPRRSLALLDELDKAPRDAPNDVLGELEGLSFRIRELDIEITAAAPTWPILLITSNSERSLPDAFLRRCVFHWIEFPEPERLRRIVAARCADDYGFDAEDPLLVSGTQVFMMLRDKVENKRPATAELISFLVALIEFGFARSATVSADDPRVTRLFGTMMKTQVDLAAALGKPLSA